MSAEEDHARPERSLSPEAVTCRGSLRDLDRCSPAPSAASMERYLSQPAGQDSVPTEVIESALQDNCSLITPPVDARLESTIACTACRNRRVRCDGETPTCARYFKPGTICNFEDWPKLPHLGYSFEHTTPLSRSRHQSPMRAFSIAGSDNSIGSQTSFRSWGSRISIDSRGSRRGRKRWIRPQTPPAAHRQKVISRPADEVRVSGPHH